MIDNIALSFSSNVRKKNVSNDMDVERHFSFTFGRDWLKSKGEIKKENWSKKDAKLKISSTGKSR